MTSTQKIWVAMIAVAIIALFGIFLPKATGLLSGTTNYDTLDVSDGYQVDGTTVIDGSGVLRVGSTSNTQTYSTSGTCNLYSGASITSIAASSTRFLDCQSAVGTAGPTALSDIPAWTAGDVVFMTAPTTTPATNAGLRAISATASTTAGYIRVELWNGTGAAYTLTSSATSTWNYFFER